jgi:hypothetical protein
LPHVPQWLVLVRTSVSQPSRLLFSLLQLLKFAPQLTEHWLLEQDALPPLAPLQPALQLPQCVVLLRTSVSQPSRLLFSLLQLLKFAPQLTEHTPELLQEAVPPLAPLQAALQSPQLLVVVMLRSQPLLALLSQLL